ncbi:uncharacterized protein Dvir_GJ27138, isoform B [Drosophila virilis]|uniref:Uncharacterized protein, isoform B n=1 Tax=Drosophila virilis TaxID=7244 RepID=A0A0Q9WTI7_DROVI|nr:uncharacterized protein LOC26531908 isoform X2 [Drosophila virilis]XP_032294837.1 uncharacterized protein LOC116651833 isoform X2 [Drosophila virilis]KRF84945.1 uncharacterized protein Dvir_GJ27138, isoform B [Drosophila virilis]
MKGTHNNNSYKLKWQNVAWSAIGRSACPTQLTRPGTGTGTGTSKPNPTDGKQWSNSRFIPRACFEYSYECKKHKYELPEEDISMEGGIKRFACHM